MSSNLLMTLRISESLRIPRMIILDSLFNFFPVMPNQSLDRPCCSISKSTNSVSFNLLCNFLKYLSIKLLQAYQFQQNQHFLFSFSLRYQLAMMFLLYREYINHMIHVYRIYLISEYNLLYLQTYLEQ